MASDFDQQLYDETVKQCPSFAFMTPKGRRLSKKAFIMGANVAAILSMSRPAIIPERDIEGEIRADERIRTLRELYDEADRDTIYNAETWLESKIEELRSRGEQS